MHGKPAASLSSGLLARKGHARPAMRPQGFVALSPAQMAHDDLGWNDMGEGHAAAVAQPVSVTPEPAPAPAPVAARPPVLQQRAQLDARLAAPRQAPQPEAPAAVAIERAAPEPRDARAKAAFTLRLDPDRHLRLRLASAVRHQSAQQLVTEALDAFLETLTDVDGLARQVAARDGRE
ncbi:hypothetical protein ACFQ1E_06815 [Sphingomonas canadensis]|uniref:Ribbon-helix-helix protein CopG domain-containing protein n=1 Tax=Sphingomonas canadensis TaxID=1219257 RepID=A0ABW3H9D6_9SPHN|nr:hypothetical protein [Sphingomonas canadensis]MCW3835501.1 hypothetical protein [Sphingomonas canadensis]